MKKIACTTALACILVIGVEVHAQAVGLEEAIRNATEERKKV